MNSQISSYLQDLFELMPSGITRLSLDYKTTSGIKTDEASIVFGVQKKLPLNELSGGYIIPKTLQFDNMVYKTDVIEAGRAFYIPACHNPNANPLPAIIQSHRSGHRPLKGGVSLVCQSNNRLLTGTLGLICIDNVNSGFVGLTNAHVALGPEHYVFGPDEFNYNNVNKKVVQKTESSSETSSDVIGNVFKFFPVATERIDFDGFPDSFRNYIDAALVTIRKCGPDNVPLINTAESFKQLNIDYPYPMKFATTEEIDNMFGTNIPLFHAGRTTGPKGQSSCPLRITDLSPVQIELGDIESNHVVKYFDIIGFAYADGANHPISGGDSGSVLIADLNGEYKIIGLVFAGQALPTPNIGYACRIDNVANLLNISAWDGLSYPHLSYPPRYYTTSTGYFIRETADIDTKDWNITFKDHSFAGFADFPGILNAITAGRDLTGVPIPCVDSVYENIRNNFVEHKMIYNITSGSGSFVVDNMLNPTFRFVRDIGDMDTQTPGDPWLADYGASYTLNVNAGGHKIWIKTWPVTGTDYIFTTGVTNNGATNGSIVIKIPDYDSELSLLPWPSPHILYYASETDPKMKGKIFTYKSLDADEDGDGVDNFSEIEDSTNPFVATYLETPVISLSTTAISTVDIRLNINWIAVPNATSYKFDISTCGNPSTPPNCCPTCELGQSNFSTFVGIYNNFSVNGFGHSIQGLASNTIYYVRVKAFGPNNIQSLYSETSSISWGMD